MSTPQKTSPKTFWDEEQMMCDFDDQVDETSSDSQANSVVSTGAPPRLRGPKNSFNNKGFVPDNSRQELIEELNVAYIRKQRDHSARCLTKSNSVQMNKVHQSENRTYPKSKFQKSKKASSQIYNSKSVARQLEDSQSASESVDDGVSQTRKNFQVTEDIRFLLRKLSKYKSSMTKNSEHKNESLLVTVNDIEAF